MKARIIGVMTTLWLFGSLAAYLRPYLLAAFSMFLGGS